MHPKTIFDTTRARDLLDLSVALEEISDLLVDLDMPHQALEVRGIRVVVIEEFKKMRVEKL